MSVVQLETMTTFFKLNGTLWRFYGSCDSAFNVTKVSDQLVLLICTHRLGLLSTCAYNIGTIASRYIGLNLWIISPPPHYPIFDHMHTCRVQLEQVADTDLSSVIREMSKCGMKVGSIYGRGLLVPDLSFIIQ